MRIRSEEIYEALDGPEALAALNRRIATAIDAQSWIVGWIYKDGVQILPDATAEWSSDLLEEYARDYAHLDPWTQAQARDLRPNQVTDVSQLVPDRVWEGSVVYNEFIMPRGLDVFRALSVAAATELGMGCFAFHRGKRLGSFSDDHTRNLSGISRDLARMLGLMARIERAELRANANGAIANSVHSSILLVDNRGRILQANDAAINHLRAGDVVEDRAGRLEFRGPSATAASAAVAAASARTGVTSTSLLLAREGRPPLVATFVPKSLPDGRRCALVWLSDSMIEGRRIEKQLYDLFGLTRAEALIAEQIASGFSPTEIAEVRDAALATVRSQIKSIYAKLGCTKQTEVCALLNRLPNPVSVEQKEQLE